MNRNKTLIAVGVFVGLLAIYLATHDSKVSVGIPSLELPKLEAASIIALELSGAQQALLKKEGAAWKVADPKQPAAAFAADDAQVEQALQALAQVRAGDFVTEHAQKHGELEVDDAKGLKVKVVTSSGPAAEWVFGKGATTGGTYFRDAKKPAVFVTASPVAWQLKKDVKAWRKRAFLAGKAEGITRLTVKHEDGTQVTVEKKGEAWVLPEGTATPSGFRFDPAAAQRAVGQLSSLYAQDFVDAGATDEALGLSGPHATVEAESLGGQKLLLHLGKALEQDLAGLANSKGAVPVRVEGEAQVYLVAQAAVAPARPRLSDLRDLGLFSFDPEKVTQLVIQAGAKKVVAKREGTAWTVTEPKQLPAGLELDPEQIAAQVRALRQLKALGLAEGTGEAQAGLKKPTVRVEVTAEGLPAQSLLLGSAAGSHLYARGAVDALVYTVPAEWKARYERGVELFKKQAMPQFGPGAMKGLEQLPPEIRQQLEAQLRQRAAAAQ